ncbi:asparagine synthase (glutamine-hydrolyzing) [uncultured Thiodictyon sp.]|uniref:asparagine synthase (glutamine-hydrolyzing) n=1 Tax=uncultured Thiodictyon sp. TaxID=1846217 RepID=UPI0025F39572|nr:asparagine synthase (glutamine-hydrolyzing) [uncultured Thiodictyon sp.]
MCGLIFGYDPSRAQPALVAAAGRALRALAHRGPDAEGLVCAPGLVIGHRRLSIIDLAASAQPMEDALRRYVLAYNGEVYNYRALRERLAGRWTLRTQGDTEVLLAGLVLEGTAFLDHAEGMWALSLWDRAAHTLLLARDRMGKKPLYYWTDHGRFCAASELPALLALLPVRPPEDLDSTADYLRYGYYLPGTTAYQGVREVLPGHWLSWSPAAGCATGAYWQLRVGGFRGNRAQAHERLRETLAAAVQRRLVADVEVGAFLSGGVDSSLMVALAAQVSGSPPKTFTIGFTEAAFDERIYAREVAHRLGTDHYEEVLGVYEPQALEHLVLQHVGQPFADSSLLPTALVSNLAARHVKVALSGDGGDELFGGYQRYLGPALLRWYTRLPRPLRAGAERAIRALPEPMAHHSRSLLKKAHLFVDLVGRAVAETPYVAPLIYRPDELAALAPDLAGRGHPPPGIPAVCDADDVWRMMVSDAIIYLPQDILLKVDRASMAASLEARAPFLDREVVELAFSLPRRWHLAGLGGKQMLAESFKPLLPPAIWARRKQGFAVPVHRWFAGALGDALEARLADPALPFVPAVVSDLLAAHRSGRRDYGHRLWQIYIYCLWRQGRSE